MRCASRDQRLIDHRCDGCVEWRLGSSGAKRTPDQPAAATGRLRQYPSGATGRVPVLPGYHAQQFHWSGLAPRGFPTGQQPPVNRAGGSSRDGLPVRCWGLAQDGVHQLMGQEVSPVSDMLATTAAVRIALKVVRRGGCRSLAPHCHAPVGL